jgi:hypothetical protein
MPKNTTGGKGHRGRKNGEGNTAMKNRTFVEAFIEDIRSNDDCAQIHVARIVRKVGNNRMGAFYVDEKGVGHTENATIKGSLRGRGKSQARIDIGTIVLLNNTGLGGFCSFEIVAVMTDEQVHSIREDASIDPRIFAKDIVDEEVLKAAVKDNAGFEFDYEIDIAAI